MAESYTQDGETARQIAQHIPYYPFKGIDRFYDIQGMLNSPEAFQQCVNVFVERYRGLAVDKIAGLDARGFVIGPPIALALGKPFVMLRKKGKLPNAITGDGYRKEYAEQGGDDALCCSRTAIAPGDRVLVIDDLVATGGTLVAACELLTTLRATVVECACIVELKALQGTAKLTAQFPDTAVWSLISEDILTVAGTLAEDS